MAALLTAFIAAALAEFGDKTQLLVVALLAAYRRPVPILAGLAAAALASCLIAAWGGAQIHAMITVRAASLFLALALLYAGAVGLIGTRTPRPVVPGRTPAFLAAFICLLAGEMGDKTQFLTAGIAAQYDMLWLTGLGAAAGMIAANLPVAMLGPRFADAIPLRALRYGSGALFLFAGAVVGAKALRLM